MGGGGGGEGMKGINKNLCGFLRRGKEGGRGGGGEKGKEGEGEKRKEGEGEWKRDREGEKGNVQKYTVRD